MRIERNILKKVRNSDIDKSGVFNIPDEIGRASCRERV